MLAVLKVTIDEKTGEISVWNNGQGVPVEMHQKAQMYVPQFIFGNMRTGSNYDDLQKRTTGGRNGFGAKLTNVFSKKFKVETQDKKRGLRYSQTWTNNMGNFSTPEIKKCQDKDYTCITFTPDYARFGPFSLFLLFRNLAELFVPYIYIGLQGLDADHVALLKRRVYDLAGTANANCPRGQGLKVYLSGKKLGVETFKDYVACFIDSATAEPVWEIVNDRWEICATVSDGDGFAQVFLPLPRFSHFSFLCSFVSSQSSEFCQWY